MDQFGYCLGAKVGNRSGAGVFGGENMRSEPPWGVKGISSMLLKCDIGYSVSVISSSSTRGSSILGIGMSAAATDARNCSVGALRFDAFLLLTRNRGRGGDGG